MKSKMILAGALATAVVSSAFAADINVVLVGSTAFRNITYDRIINGGIFNTSVEPLQKTTLKGSVSSYQTFRGKAANGLGVNANDWLVIRCNFIGSIEGMQALNTLTPQDGRISLSSPPQIHFL